MALSASSVLSDSVDLAREVSGFLADQFVNTAGISRAWRRAWGSDTPKTTRGVDAHTTVGQFLDHLALGLGTCSSGALATAAGPCREAAFLGRTDLLRAAYDSGLAKKHRSACEGAADNGRLETLKFLRSVECPWDEATACAVARSGHMDALRWVIDNGCPSNGGTQLWAASNGDLEMVVFLHYNGHPVTSSVLSCAVYSGWTDIIDWARSIGIEHARTFTAAVEAGLMEVLAHLRDTRHSFDSDDVESAVRYGNLDEPVVDWLVANGYVEAGVAQVFDF